MKSYYVNGAMLYYDGDPPTTEEIEKIMADEKKKRRGRVPFAEKRQELMDAISRSDAHTEELRGRLKALEVEYRDKIAAMQKELEA